MIDNKILYKYIVENIKNEKIYNTSYREYIVIFKDYIIYIYPYILQVFKYDYKTYDLFVYRNSPVKFYNMINSTILQYHHNDFTKNICNYDPCVLYEELTKDYVHTYKEIKKNDDVFYENNKNDIQKYLISKIRKEKISKINIIN